jgi:hypothetical protein
MASFVVHGPFEMTHEKKKNGRILVFDDFWDEDAQANYLAEECGCYVFAVRSGGGLQPLYVGKATKTFKQEAFNSSNKYKYHNGFSNYAAGTPVMYFVVHPSQKGPTNEKCITEIESFLIQSGAAKNPNIQNIKGTQRPNWSIKGVVRSKVGRRSEAEAQFGSLFDIRHK